VLQLSSETRSVTEFFGRCASTDMAPSTVATLVQREHCADEGDAEGSSQEPVELFATQRRCFHLVDHVWQLHVSSTFIGTDLAVQRACAV
jgi:hypothetical protein